MSEERRVADGQRRSIDKLLEILVDEVKGFRQDVSDMRGEIKPLRELARQISAAKMAAVFGFGALAIIGSFIAWWINVREGVKAAVQKL